MVISVMLIIWHLHRLSCFLPLCARVCTAHRGQLSMSKFLHECRQLATNLSSNEHYQLIGWQIDANHDIIEQLAHHHQHKWRTITIKTSPSAATNTNIENVLTWLAETKNDSNPTLLCINVSRLPRVIRWPFLKINVACHLIV
jgi:hypothetical protein